MVKVAVAMSGGVDSSVAAALLKEQGYGVFGVTMRLDDRDTADAEKAARQLGIPHRVVDLRDVFASEIIDYFCREYGEGRTPNPCVRCNRYIKFGALLEEALAMGAEYIATGHHARVEKDDNSGRYLLKKGADRAKDQSYFLSALTQEQLSRVLFPVGSLTKEKVRQIAASLDLPTEKPESQEICFIPDDDYPAFIQARSPEGSRPGPIIDEGGNTLGEHRGILNYTVGQRRGLGIAAPEPLYVTAISREKNAVMVGTKEETYGRELTATGLNWIAAPPQRSFRTKARIRYRHTEAEAEVAPVDDDAVYVNFTKPQMAITPGQTVVFYDGDTVIGGGTISERGN